MRSSFSVSGRPRDCTTEDGTVYEKEHGDQQYLQEVC